MRIVKNEKGFNLFSAIVAAVLFMSGVMLVQTMVATEDRISGQVFSMEENFALSDAANLARSDSVQTFNYHFRAKLEEYLTNPANEFPILYRNRDGETNYNYQDEEDWKQIIEEFEKQILLTGSSDATIGASGDEEGNKFRSVLRFVSERMINEFSPGAYGRYDVALDVDNTNEAITITTDALADAIGKAKDDGENFLEVLDCDMDEFSHCPQGTFYFNIPLNKIDDESYEALPRIIVKDLITGEEIKIAILPKSNLRVYIPLRFFKAAHESLIRYSFAVSENHDDFADYELGYCGDGCGVNNDPLSNPPSERSGAVCATNANHSGALALLRGNPAGLSQYPTYGQSTTGSLGLRASVTQEICDYLDFDSWSGNENFINVDGIAGPVDEQGLEANNEYIINEILCPVSNIKVNTGTFKTKKINVGSGSSTTTSLHCGEVVSIEVVLEFRETNQKYIVSGEENRYKIKIVDEDFPRTPAPATPGECVSQGNADTDSSSNRCCVPSSPGGTSC